MLLAQFFGVLMNVTTRVLEVEGNKGKGLHPFHILFARMSITMVLASLYAKPMGRLYERGVSKVLALSLLLHLRRPSQQLGRFMCDSWMRVREIISETRTRLSIYPIIPNSLGHVLTLAVRF